MCLVIRSAKHAWLISSTSRFSQITLWICMSAPQTRRFGACVKNAYPTSTSGSHSKLALASSPRIYFVNKIRYTFRHSCSHTASRSEPHPTPKGLANSKPSLSTAGPSGKSEPKPKKDVSRDNGGVTSVELLFSLESFAVALSEVLAAATGADALSAVCTPFTVSALLKLLEGAHTETLGQATPLRCQRNWCSVSSAAACATQSGTSDET
jgi:hypothetical protein